MLHNDIDFDETEDQDFESLVHSKVREATTLNDLQKEQLLNLLLEFRNVFSEKPGKVKGYQCMLYLRDHYPFFLKPYNIPFSKRKDVEKEIQKMETWDVNGRSRSTYNNPLVVVSKRNGGMRILLVSRHGNKFIIRENDHPENVDELLHKSDYVVASMGRSTPDSDIFESCALALAV